MGEIRELIRLLDETGLSELRLETDDMKLHLKKAEAAAPTVSPTHVQVAAPADLEGQVAPASATPQGTGDAEGVPQPIDKSIHIITSPMVGTFYSAPSPDAEPYVGKGSAVSAKSIVCIVEAMKLMNEIEAEVAGEVIDIMAENGQLVEYGQPLYKIKLS